MDGTHACARICSLFTIDFWIPKLASRGFQPAKIGESQPLTELVAARKVFRPWTSRVYFPDTTGEVIFPWSFFEKYRGSVPPVLGNSQLKGEPVDGKDYGGSQIFGQLIGTHSK